MHFNKNVFLIFVAVLFLSFACAPKPKYTNRFDSYTIENKSPSYSATITAFSLPVKDSSKSTTILNLSDRGQAAFIKAVKEYSDENKNDFIKTLASAIKPSSKPPSVILDKTEFSRRVVFSIENTSTWPADRIDRVKVTLSFPENINKPEFKSWDKFSSKYETVDLGSLTYTQSNSFSASVSGSIPISSPISIGGEASISRDLQEKLLLRDRRVVSTGQLTTKKAVIIQEGSVGLDLTGNMTVDLIVDVPNIAEGKWITYITNLFNKATPNPPNKVIVKQRLVQSPISCQDPIMGEVVLDYVLRHVPQGFDTGDISIAEGDDKVKLIYGSTKPAEFVIVPSSELALPVWQIIMLTAWGEQVLHIKGVRGQDMKMIRFPSYGMATQFMDWLNIQKKTTVGRYNLRLGRKKLTSNDIPELNIKRVVLNTSAKNGVSCKK